jgi:hypothetical protein
VPIPVEQKSNIKTFTLLSIGNCRRLNVLYIRESLNKQQTVITMRMLAWVTASACKYFSLESHSEMFDYLHVSKIRSRWSRKLTINATMPSAIINSRGADSPSSLKIIESEASNMHRQNLSIVRQRK